jgi:hypothetical protein
MKRLTVLLALTLAFAPALFADAIDFTGFVPGGSMSFNPAVGNSLSVQGVPLNLLYLVSNPSDYYWFAPAPGTLSFTTGPATSINTSCPGVCANFGAGTDPSTPDLLISGTLFHGATMVASGTLIKGEFMGGSAQFANSIGGISGSFAVTEMNPNLLTALFGAIPNGSMTATLGQVAFNLATDSEGNYSGRFSSTNVLATIPEPGSLILLGTALLLSGKMFRRFRPN